MWALAPIGMLAAFSCQDDLVAERQPVASGDEIAFSVASDSTWAAMSRSEKKMNRHFITMIGKDSVFLQVVEEKNTDMPFATQDDESRSASFTTENLKSFSLHAYYNNKEQFMMNQVVNKSGDNWTYSPVKYWPNNPGDVISFYGYARYNDKGTFTAPDIDEEYQKGSFSYTLPAAETDAEKNDAINQPDLIFAITPDQKKPTVTDKVELVFHHALSAILFKMGNLPEGVMITDVSLKNVSTSGECIYQLGENDMKFAWELEEDKADYTQTFNVTKTGTEEQLISEGEKLFMMLPQNLTENDVLLEISIKVDKKVHVLQTRLDLEDFPKAWAADTKYTYIISTNGLVDVEIEDECTPTIKSDVKIQNTGLSDAYIRATIVGYWVNEAGIIVSPWSFDDKTKGTIDWETEKEPYYWQAVSGATKWSDYWKKGEDGFYYYKYLVSPTQYVYPLFDTYTLKEDAPFSGAELIVNVVVQAKDASW